MIEKLGHSKSMQVMRKTWIDESKPRDPQVDLEIRAPSTKEDNSSNTLAAMAEPRLPQTPIQTNVNEVPQHAGRESDPDNLFLSEDEESNPANGAPDEDELDALLAEESTAPSARPSVPTLSLTSNILKDAPPADDVDALLAEHEAEADFLRTSDTAGTPATAHRPASTHDDFADEMEAMDDVDMW